MNFIVNTFKRTFMPPSAEAIMAVKETVESAIAGNRVVVFSKSYCPYCTRAKSLLRSIDAPFVVFEMDELPDGTAMQAYLREKNGQSSVPNIYVSQRHVGGCDDLVKANSDGSLTALLKADSA
ncbi:thioredoxin reductase [Thoreauomyces humboldtii]|nr:thioredoxin reductase [Thoreauomyces humboldtii]